MSQTPSLKMIALRVFRWKITSGRACRRRLRRGRFSGNPCGHGGQCVTGGPVGAGLALVALRLNDFGDDFGQFVVARYGLEDFATCDGVGSCAPARVNGYSVDDFSVDLGLETT